MKTWSLSLVLLALSLDSKAASSDSEAVWSTVGTMYPSRRQAAHSLKINPSTNLTWVPCYDSGFECTRFPVPLDYTSSNSSLLAIALVRLPSSLSKDDKNYRGPVLFNPGGPGGSGVDWILSIGPAMQKILGSEYDIVGFDPRAVGRTTPVLPTFASALASITFSIKVSQDPPLGATPDALARTYARYASLGTVAEARLKDIGPYVNTPFVARDMLAITKAHGFDKLKYWGVSYGTALGMTFASMFPDNVERLVLDGVLDAHDYYTTRWRTTLLDTDKVLDYFYDKCAEVGPQECALYEKTPGAIKARVEKIFNSLKHKPLPVVIGNGPQDYGVVDYSMVRNTVFAFLWQPLVLGGKNVSIMLASLEQGDGSLLYASQLTPSPGLQCSCDGSSSQEDIDQQPTTAISCSDGDPVNDTLSDLQKWFEDNRKESTFAELWPPRIICAGWKIRAAEKFEGSQTGGNTSFPILFIGNTADPATPLVGAKKMSKLFKKSVVLTIDTPGHTSFAATSPCNALAVRAYFREGTLPKPGTICSAEDELFGSGNETASAISARDELLSTLRELTKRVKVPRLGGHFRT